MKLGTQTNSLVNHLYSRMTRGQPEPEVGMGATVLCWTDRHAATINKVFMVGKRLHVELTKDHAKRTDKNGLSESQSYEFTPCPNDAPYTFRLDTDGWNEVYLSTDTKRWKKAGGAGLIIGKRDHYHDFSF